MSLIPGSTKFKAAEINVLKVDELIVNEITDGVATLSVDTIINLNNPVSNQDAANKQYVDESGAKPFGPTNSIQFNDNDKFNGSASLIFNGTVLTASAITDTIAILENGYLKNTVDPVADTQAANKQYVDRYKNLTESTIILDSPITYSATQMVNGIIDRDPVGLVFTNNTKFDTTASAESIISKMKSSEIGTSADFYINNIATNKNAFIYLKPGTNVIFNNNNTTPPLSTDGVTIPRGYTLKSKLIIISISTILIYVESIGVTKGTEIAIGYEETLIDQFTLLNLSIQGLIAYSFINTEIHFQSYYNSQFLSTQFGISYSIPTLMSGQVTRSGTFSDITDVISDQPASNFFLTITEGSTGGYRFIIRNADSVRSLTITSAFGWILDPNANWTIAPKTAAYTWFLFDTTTQTITVYMIGKSIFKV